MGEFADDAIHAGLDQSWGWRRPPYTPQPKTCKRCGQKGLYWHEYAEGWRLQEAIHYNNQWGEQIEWVKHQCQLGIKGAFAQMKLDKDPGIAYNAYLDTIPWPDHYDRR